MTPPIRLTGAEVASIKRIVAERFGPSATVRVFGSRTRLDVRGGDLDLLVEVPEPVDEAVVIRAGAEIEAALDELSTDLILRPLSRPPSRIERVAAETAILL